MRQSNNNLESSMETEQQYSNSEIHNGQNGTITTANNNNTTTKPIIERGASWGFGETKLLLALWSQDMVQRQLTNSKRTRHVWEKIAERIREHGYERTADQVRTRVFNMIAEYRRIMKNPTPERRKKCIFFDALHRIYQAKDTNSLENVIMTMGYMMDNSSGSICSISDQYNFDPLDFSNIGPDVSIDQVDGSNGDGDHNNNNNNSGSDTDERNNEILIFPLSPNAYTATNNINADDDDDDFNYDESTFAPQSKRSRSELESNGNFNQNAQNNHHHHHNNYSQNTSSSSMPLDTSASALLIDRMFSHLSKETEVMREWVNLERERLAQEVARRKEEKEREERREKIFLDVLNKLQERIFSVLKHHEKSNEQQPTQTPTSSSSSSNLNQTDRKSVV